MYLPIQNGSYSLMLFVLGLIVFCLRAQYWRTYSIITRIPSLSLLKAPSITFWTWRPSLKSGCPGFPWLMFSINNRGPAGITLKKEEIWSIAGSVRSMAPKSWSGIGNSIASYSFLLVSQTRKGLSLSKRIRPSSVPSELASSIWCSCIFFPS